MPINELKIAHDVVMLEVSGHLLSSENQLTQAMETAVASGKKKILICFNAEDSMLSADASDGIVSTSEQLERSGAQLRLLHHPRIAKPDAWENLCLRIQAFNSKHMALESFDG